MLTLNQGKEASLVAEQPARSNFASLGFSNSNMDKRNWGAQDERPLFQANDVVKPTTDDIVTCRRCGGPLERRARHRFWERNLLRLVGVYPWQCWDCQITYYRRARNTVKPAGR